VFGISSTVGISGQLIGSGGGIGWGRDSPRKGMLSLEQLAIVMAATIITRSILVRGFILGLLLK